MTLCAGYESNWRLCHAEAVTKRQRPRTCVGCREVAPKGELVRFVIQQGQLVIDRAQRLPGRGAYLHPSANCVQAAQRSGGFARSFRRRIDPAQVAGVIEGLSSAG